MTMAPLIIDYPAQFPTPSPRRTAIDEAIMVLGTATGGGADRLTVNVPYKFTAANVSENAPANATARDALIAEGDWQGVFHEAQTKDNISQTLDETVRRILSLIRDDVIVVRIAQTGSAPPTPAQINAAITGAQRAPALLGADDVPGFVIMPYLTVQRAATSPYAAITPQTAAVPSIVNLDALAEGFNGTAVIGGDASFDRTEAVTWAGFHRHEDTVAVWPAIAGAGGTEAEALDPAVSYVVSALRKEDEGTGRGTSLNNMRARGVSGTTPAISQSKRDTNADTNLLNAAGITTLYRGESYWRFQGITVNAVIGAAILPEQIVSVERFKFEVDQLLEHYAELAGDQNITNTLQDFIIDHMSAEFSAMVGEGRIQSGTITPSTPFVTGGTQVNFDFEIRPYLPVTSFRFTGSVMAPTF